MGSVPGLSLMPRAFAFAQAAQLEAPAGGGESQKKFRKPDTVDRYIDPLPIPKRLSPEGTEDGEPVYRVRMMEFSQPLHSQLPSTRLWGYEGQYPGPILEVPCGKPFRVRWENRLPAKHMFPVDAHLRSAIAPAPEVRTAPRIEGALEASTDPPFEDHGFIAGQLAHCRYANRQQATMLWYHDQAPGIARLNVQAGLAGMCLLRAEDEARLGLPAGPYEVPLVLQDRTLDSHGQLVYEPCFDDGQLAPRGSWGPQFFGDLPVVNGAIYPYLQVEPRRYRLRILNAANFRFLDLFFNLASNAADIPAIVSFQSIGSDGGFLRKPAELSQLLLAPGERADLVVDFSGHEGKTVTLFNRAAAPYPGWNVIHPVHRALYEWIQFRVTAPLADNRPGVRYSLPPAAPMLSEGAALATRDFVLADAFDHGGRSLGVEINGKGYDDPITEKVKAGSIEKWRFVNSSDDAHPMHIQQGQFQVLHRQGFDPIALRGGTVVLVGKIRPAASHENGWKDTAVVHPGEVLTLLVQFSREAGRSAFYSTLLEPQDRSLMRPFEILPAGHPTTAA